LAAAGQTAEARKLLATLNDMVHRGSAYPVYAALIHMGLGQRNEALDAIEENGDAKIYGDLVQWHVFEELKTDPRYQKLVAKAREIRTSRPSPDVSAQCLRLTAVNLISSQVAGVELNRGNSASSVQRALT
jgi:hypothetical protein